MGGVKIHFFKIDWENQVINSSVNVFNEIEQFKQKVYMALKTMRFEFPIYDNNYGSDFHTLNDKNLNRYHYEMEIERMTQEVLESMEEVRSVLGIELEEINNVTIKIIVHLDTIYGEINNININLVKDNG